MVGKTDFAEINAEMEALEKKASRYKNSSPVNWWTVKPGDHKMFILPPSSDGAPLFKKVTIFHGYVDSAGKKRAYKSSMEEYGTCPLMDNWKRLKEEGNETRAKEVRPQTIYLYNVRDFVGENRVLCANTSQHKSILATLQHANLDGVDATDLTEGFTVTLSRLTSPPWATSRLALKPTVLTQEEINKSLSNLVDLETVYQSFSPEELQSMLNGEDIIKVKKEDTSSDKEESKGKGIDFEKRTKTKPKAEEVKKEIQETIQVEEDEDLEAIMRELE